MVVRLLSIRLFILLLLKRIVEGLLLVNWRFGFGFFHFLFFRFSFWLSFFGTFLLRFLFFTFWDGTCGAATIDLWDLACWAFTFDLWDLACWAFTFDLWDLACWAFTFDLWDFTFLTLNFRYLTLWAFIVAAYWLLAIETTCIKVIIDTKISTASNCSWKRHIEAATGRSNRYWERNVEAATWCSNGYWDRNVTSDWANLATYLVATHLVNLRF